ncbi:MAG: hypothetical protein GF350_06665 [Chitinivibrionales bacterium]|nr:hypothetical protein [Chitinivibrionales bacterium]
MRSYRWPLFALLFGCFASAILGDSTAEALLLANFGPDKVPGLFMVNALFLFFSSSVILSIIDRADRGRFFLYFILVHSAVLILVRIAVFANLTFLFIPLFSYAYVTKILLFLMFWTLANDLIDSRKAGYEFPFIAAGGTLGAIGISFSIPWLLKIIPAENLVLVWGILMFGVAMLFIPIRRNFGIYFKASSDQQKHAGRSIKTLLDDSRLMKTEPLLWNMAVLYFMIFFVFCNQQFSFYSVLKVHFQDSPNQARDLARFLGYFMGVTMGATFLLQISLAGFVLKKAGSTRSMFIVPVVLCLIFGVLSAFGFYDNGGYFQASSGMIFWGVTLGVGTRMAFFDSFFSPNFQVFFSSFPHNIRGRGKLLIEGAVKPVAIVLAGLWLLFVAPKLAFKYQMVLMFAISVVMIVQTGTLKRNYSESLTRYLARYDKKDTQWLKSIIRQPKEEYFLKLIRDILDMEDESLKRYAIELLAMMESPESVSLLLDHIDDPEGITRARIVGALSRTKDPKFKHIFLQCLDDSYYRVVANAIEALARYRDDEITSRTSGFLDHESGRVRANAVVALWQGADGALRARLTGVITTMLHADDPGLNSSALYALGELKIPELKGELDAFFERHRKTIAGDYKLWRQFVLAHAKWHADDAIERLLMLSHNAARKARSDLSYALGYMVDTGYPASQFLRRIKKVDYVKRNILLKALYNRSVYITVDDQKVLQEIAREEGVAAYADWVALHALEKEKQNAGDELLECAILEECIQDRTRNLFYIAALLDETGQIKKVMHRLYHPNPHVRARALEVLDNSGDSRINKWLITLLETDNSSIHSREGQDRYGLNPVDKRSVIDKYKNNPNTWVKECARFAETGAAV